MKEQVVASNELAVELIDGPFRGSVIATNMDGWGVGDINAGAKLLTTREHAEHLSGIMEYIVPVAEAERAYSDCTDGRKRLELCNGSIVPVRQKLVGADMMMAFHMAEALGDQFYKRPYAPLSERLREVGYFLKKNDYMPSTHEACGAAGGFTTVLDNQIRFSKVPSYVDRQADIVESLVGPGWYDPQVRQQLSQNYAKRLHDGRYKAWSDQLVLDAVMEISGERAIARLLDDGRGVHGHVEDAIVRIIGDYAFDVNGYAEANDGAQAFSSNDSRLLALARLISARQQSASKPVTRFRVALLAGLDSTDAAHGTLGSDMPTYLVQPVNSMGA